MRQETAVDGFQLVYDRSGANGQTTVVLLHGWPGDRSDYRAVVPLIAPVADTTSAAGSRRPSPSSVLIWSAASKHLDHLVSVYGPPGAFAASVAWYRAGAGAIAASVTEKAPALEDRLAVRTGPRSP